MCDPKTIKPNSAIQNYMIMTDYITANERLSNFKIKKKNLFWRIFFINKHKIKNLTKR